MTQELYNLINEKEIKSEDDKAYLAAKAAKYGSNVVVKEEKEEVKPEKKSSKKEKEE